MTLIRSTQIWSILLDTYLVRYIDLGLSASGVTVHGISEKWGIHSEVVDVWSTDQLGAYLKEKNPHFDT
jgi:hypothetical protein